MPETEEYGITVLCIGLVTHLIEKFAFFSMSGQVLCVQRLLLGIDILTWWRIFSSSAFVRHQGAGRWLAADQGIGQKGRISIVYKRLGALILVIGGKSYHWVEV